MTPQELKNSILQLAVQGKLVPQRPEEGSAEELLAAIRAQKQSSDSRSTVRKKKNSHKDTETRSDVPADEIPFEIPASWKWVRLGEIVFNREQVKPTESFSYIDIGSIDNKKQKLSIKENVIEAKNAPSRARKIVRQGDILYSTVRPYLHNTCIVDRSFSKTPIASTGFAVMACREGISNKYLFYFLLSPTFDSYANDSENSKGVAYPAINDSRLYNAPIALPPLAEQKRIVAKIEELLPLCERYGNAYNELQALNKRVPGDLQKSLLQLAVQGKLVPQRPEEGSAEELLAAIRSEKQKLLKAGKIKKEKPLPEISDDEIPYELPANWRWERFGNLGSYKKGPFGSALTKSIFVPKGEQTIKVYEQKNAIQKNIAIGDYYIPNEYFETKMKGFELFPGDIIVSCAGTIGETYVMPEHFERGIINQALMRMKIFEPLHIPYFLVFFDFVLKKNAQSGSKGSAIKNIPPFEVLKNYLVPLPPLAEQKRIVAKIEELLPLCEQLSSA